MNKGTSNVIFCKQTKKHNLTALNSFNISSGFGYIGCKSRDLKLTYDRVRVYVHSISPIIPLQTARSKKKKMRRLNIDEYARKLTYTPKTDVYARKLTYTPEN